jgi:hypothetical protein
MKLRHVEAEKHKIFDALFSVSTPKREGKAKSNTAQTP